MAKTYQGEERFAGGLRSGQDYIDALKDDGRRVFIDGEEVNDVTSHPAFREAVSSIACMYDIAHDPANREVMTYPSPITGSPVNRSWQLPRSRDDLTAKRVALAKLSESNLGFMGRTPDHVAGFFVGWVMAPEIFAVNDDTRFKDNLIRFYEFLRDHDAYITYTIVPPQIDRSKPAHQQDPPDLYAGVVEERDDGIVLRGAQMLGTGTALSDYVLLSTIRPLGPGDENHAINVAVACNAPGVRIYSRRSYARAAGSVYDYPLSSRFDETDALVVYDNVLVPWEQVFVYKNIDICRDQWWVTSAHVMGNNQAQIRFTTKLRFMVGIAQRIAEMNGVAALPPVQALLADLAVQASVYEGLLDAQIATATITANGYAEPGRQALYAAMMMQSEIYPKMLDLIRELAGGGLIQLPSSVEDFSNPEIRADIERYVQSPDHSAEERVKLMKLAWDLVGSEFAGRHDQYEKFYAGAPFVVKMNMYRNYDFATSRRLVDQALAGYDLAGRRADND
ncbi:MAG: 4-hydroxyphenylacetate 3-hydroxylase N-terminal domain-containing protein [Alphaproteobacteria bacterium]|nr:4-hydroxyphenylacetate 3-hydroxylase N-terminal domain-containing protein [Alphaproteobacteria bacterium]